MRVYNFSAGPAAVPEEVLRIAADEMLDWHGSGMSVMEMSHRGPEFTQIAARAQADLRLLLGISSDFAVLFMQGGAIAQNALVPLNLLGDHANADYVDTGAWSGRSIAEARRYCSVHVAASGEADHYTRIPLQSEWHPSPSAAYLHICTNETIGGLEYHWVPQMLSGVPLVADMSSDFLARPLEMARYGLIYAGAQKNSGIAGLTIVIVRRDLLGRSHALCPSAFDYQIVAQNESMFNTPPTYSIYLAGLVFQWLLRQAVPGKSALESIQARNLLKARRLYAALDATAFYETRVAKEDRSLMNVPFFLADPRLEEVFLTGAKERGMAQLKGHKSLGGLRASIYNAMPVSGVDALVDYLGEFERRYG